ncbi:MAG: TAXI family TRAP transporter solute-binding subunit [Pontibacterium sp.]
MKTTRVSSTLIFLTGLAVLMGAVPAMAQQFMTIGTGGVTGVYYPAGGAICRLMNKERKEHGVRCAVESTDGSIYNLNAVQNGELDMGVAQSDWQYHAYNGSDKFEAEGGGKALRSVFSIHPEPFTIVARADSGIKNLEDIKGKRVNIGNPGSGQRGTLEVLMKAHGWTWKDFAQVTELKASEQAGALCENKIDVMVYVVGHPSGAVKEATTACDSVLVDVPEDTVRQLTEARTYYRAVTIPGGLYRGNLDDTRTFGVGATVVVSSDMSDDMVYITVKAVFENFDIFRNLHPAFGRLKKEQMVKEGLSAPLHPGALKYYREVGLL